MQQTINGVIVTFTLDTEGKVIKISIPIAGGGDASQDVTFVYGVPLATATAIVQQLLGVA